MELTGQIIDVVHKRIFSGTISIKNGRIAEIIEDSSASTQVRPRGSDGHSNSVYAPGFVDAHVHIESSMLAPSEFARVAPIHGTVATVSDPHEIANVLGIEGVRWMVENASQTPFKFHFGAPSCVPATPFETAGASFAPDDVEALLNMHGVHYLAEVMNFPAVIARDERMMAIIEVAKKLGRRVDGHAPGVIGDDLKAYVAAGIETDHECILEEEGRQRAELGMKVAIREGSAARNFEALWPLLNTYPDSCFYCSDDKHPDDLVVSHIDDLLRRSVAYGVDSMTALRVATKNPVEHYGLSVGLLQPGDPADIVELEDIINFRVKRCWIDGELMAESGKPLLERQTITILNTFDTNEKHDTDFAVPATGDTMNVIIAEDGQLVTGSSVESPLIQNGNAIPDLSRDLLKITVVNRYSNATPAIGFIKNFGLKTSAIASSVAHDSHNIVAVGADDQTLCRAVNAVIRSRGGLAYVDAHITEQIPLPIAGLMSDGDAWEVAEQFKKLTKLASDDGCTMRSPFMTLSFMALLVIPSLKIGDKGLFNVDHFTQVDLWT